MIGSWRARPNATRGLREQWQLKKKTPPLVTTHCLYIRNKHKLLDVMLRWCVRHVDAGLSAGCAANAIARLDVATVAASALEKRFWVQIPERPRPPTNRQAKTMCCKGQKRGRAFSQTHR
jgi:hypothetical protein